MSQLIYLTILLAIAVGIFILVRRYILWYFRIDERMESQQRIEELLRKINTELYNLNEKTK